MPTFFWDDEEDGNVEHIEKSSKTAGTHEAPHRVTAPVPETLRIASRDVRKKVAEDRGQIAAEAEEVIREAEANGKLQVLRVLFQPSEREILEAIDAYASRHGLNSRSQVVRIALGRLLEMEITVSRSA
jgi:hypothetical protein